MREAKSSLCLLFSRRHLSNLNAVAMYMTSPIDKVWQQKRGWFYGVWVARRSDIWGFMSGHRVATTSSGRLIGARQPAGEVHAQCKCVLRNTSMPQSQREGGKGYLAGSAMLASEKKQEILAQWYATFTSPKPQVSRSRADNQDSDWQCGTDRQHERLTTAAHASHCQ